MKRLFFRVRTEEQLDQVIASGLAGILICPPWIFDHAQGVYESCDVFLEFPDILRENRTEYAEKLIALSKKAAGVVIKNIDELGLLKCSGYTGRVIADPFLYAYNSEAAAFYKDIFGDIMFMASDELTDDELKGLWKPGQVIYKAYGRQRVMFTAQSFEENFPAKGRLAAKGDSCLRMDSPRGDSFIIRKEWPDYDTVLTERPVSMLDRCTDLPWENILVDLTSESGAELKGVIEDTAAALSGLSSDWRGEYIRGHHYKGIE